MEYPTDLVTTVPEGTSPVKVDELRAAEAVRAAELAKAGHLVRLWRPPLGPDEWRSIGLLRASLPLHIWMKVAITLLNPHPNDPEYRVWVGTSNTGLQMFIKNLRVYSNTYP
jgi:muconolactone delta-isomerase